MLVHATEPRAPVHFDCPRCLPCLVNVDTTFDGPGAGNLIGCVVKKNDDGALYALFAIIGACSVALLPIGTFFSRRTTLACTDDGMSLAIELGAELTRNADGSSATLWFFGNLMCIIFILGTCFCFPVVRCTSSVLCVAVSQNRGIACQEYGMYTP